MKVLVTGATGFLGHWLVTRLVANGHQVRILTRTSSDLGDLKKFNLEAAVGDVTNLESLISATRGVDTVFHLAGLIAYSKAQRAAMEKVNVTGTSNVITACETNGVRKLVYLSSVVAIGASFDGQIPLTEDSPYELQNLNLGYFETKKKAEALIRVAVTDGRIDAVMINPSTVYGPGDSKKGSRGVQLKVARGQFPFYTSGGANVVSVHDVVDCIMAVWERGRKGERYIVSSENILIKDLFAMIADAAGVKPPTIFLPNPLVRAIGKTGDLLEALGKKAPLNTENAWTSILFHWFDSSKAQRELGLKPRPAFDAIEESLKWSHDNGLLKT